MMNYTDKSFIEKLNLLSDMFEQGYDMGLSESEIEKAEKRLNTQFPKSLKEFYLRFGKGGSIFSNSLNTIFTPNELLNYTSEDEDDDENEDLTEEDLLAQGGDLVLAEENQVVWYCRLDKNGKDTYLDMGDGERECVMPLEDTLIWLLAVNIVTNEDRLGGECDIKDIEKAQQKDENLFIKITDKPNTVFVSPKLKIIGCYVDNENIWIGGADDEVLENFEETTKTEIGWW